MLTSLAVLFDKKELIFKHQEHASELYCGFLSLKHLHGVGAFKAYGIGFSL